MATEPKMRTPTKHRQMLKTNKSNRPKQSKYRSFDTNFSSLLDGSSMNVEQRPDYLTKTPARRTLNASLVKQSADRRPVNIAQMRQSRLKNALEIGFVS
jgi:hypothetical protein